MAKTKEQKSEIISKLERAFKNASSAVLVHFTKITVAEESAMRRGFRTDGISYTVAKKTLIRRALDKMGLDHKDVALEGEVAIAYDSSKESDPTVAARRVFQFAKQLGAEKLSILGGIFEGRFIGRDEMREIATIPPIQSLRGMFVNVISSPMRGLVIALSAISDKKQN
ncbi:MAG: 50S ribosomal protein L10 [bacterium]|nr:50S ribosomal protein L10 [bacterium]